MEKSKKKSKIKIIIITLSVCAALFMGGVLYIISMLPGAKEINSMMTTANESTIKRTQKEKTIAKTLEVNKESSEEANEIEEDEIVQPEIVKKKESTKDQVIVLKSILENENYLSVCENLREESVVDPRKEDDQYLKGNAIFDDKYENDPIIGSTRYAIKRIIRDDSIAPLLNDIVESGIAEAGEKEKSSLLDKIGFYSKAAKAAVKLRAKKKSFEKLTDRAMHLQLIASISKLKPEFAYDSELLENCDIIQKSITDEEEVDVKEERKKVLALIKKAGLSPKDLNFKPDSYTEYQVKLSKNGLYLSTESDIPEKKKE